MGGFENNSPTIQFRTIRLTLCALILTLMLQPSSCYLEFDLTRIPHETKLDPYVKNKNSQCISQSEFQKKQAENAANSKNKNGDGQDDDQKADIDYRQICYDKDISYAIELYNNKKQLYFLSIDLTTPYSWLKGQKCHVLDGGSKQLENAKKGRPRSRKSKNSRCQLIERNFKEQIYQMRDQVKEIGDKILKRGKDSEKQHNQIVEITGSSEIVKGYLQNLQDLEFWTRDSSRLARLTDILLLGFYVLDEKDKLSLKQTNFINATQITNNLNYLCDGAISLRFDQNSQKSFLSQIFTYVEGRSGITQQQIVTVYLGSDIGKNDSLTIGQLSVKHSEGGYSTLNWMKIAEDDDYGKLPVLKQVILARGENQEQSEGRNEQKAGLIEVDIDDLYAIFTLSASYISLPEKQLNQVLSKLNKMANCTVDPETYYVKCEVKKAEFQDEQIIFDFQTAKISFYMYELILKGQKHGKKAYNVTLLLKKGYNQGYAIFGEPVFMKYMMLFDFTRGKERIGVAPRRVSYGEQFINVVSLIRFVTFIFFFGCCIIICFEPVRRMMRVFLKADFSRWGGSKKFDPEARRLRQYSPIQQNPYEELKGKIQEAVNTEGSGGLQGI